MRSVGIPTLITKQLEEHEKFMPHAYQDSKGYWTIGIGRLIDKRLGGGISRAEGEILLANDVHDIEQELDRYVPWWRQLDDVRRLVVADMMFNLGGPKLSRFKNTLGNMKAGRYDEAAVGMRNSKWARVDVGARAERLARMMESGQLVPKWW